MEIKIMETFDKTQFVVIIYGKSVVTEYFPDLKDAIRFVSDYAEQN